MALQAKNKLVLVLEKITKRYCSIFFSKLVLFGQEAPEEVHRVRHYDIQCEAATNLMDILQTKVKTIEFKCFYLLKNYMKRSGQYSEKRLRVNQSHTTYAPQPKYGTERVKRNIMNFPNQKAQAISYKSREIQIRPVLHRKENIRTELSQLDESMHALISKVKNLSERFSKRNNEQSYEQPEQQDYQSLKLEKRKLILSKLSRLENELSSFLEDENIGRYQTTSNISYRRRQPAGQQFGYASHVNKTTRNHTSTAYFTREGVYGRNL